MPPNALDAEMAILGAALTSPDAAATVLEQLKSAHFVRGGHQLVFETIAFLADRGEPTNPTAVMLRMQKCGQLDRAGGGVYLHTLIQSACATAAVGYFAEQILDRAEQAALISASTSIRQAAENPDLDRGERVDTVWRLVERATESATPSAAKSVADLINPLIDTLESGADQRGVPTGWHDFDRLVPRLRPGQLITVGARPGIGKSVVMANVAHHVGVKLGLPVYAATLEMSSDEFLLRLIAADGKVNIGRLQEPELLNDDDWTRIGRAHGRLSDAGTLFLDDDPGMGLAHIRARLRAMRRAKTPAALVVVDYLQLMTTGKRTESRQVEVSQLSRSLKLLAKEFAVPIVVGSQLNRGVEQRAEKKPMLSDLRESGSVEQDSDVVVLLHREDAYDPESPRAGEIDLIVAKHRNGRTGTVTLAFQGHYARVSDMAPEPHPQRAPGHLAAVPD
jgi:replicative DNA helicase